MQAASWAVSAALYLPDGPAVPSRDAYLARLPDRLAWIHGHDVLAAGRGTAHDKERIMRPDIRTGGTA